MSIVGFTLHDLRRANEMRQKEWNNGSVLSTLYYSNALAGEVGEACNIVKKMERQRYGLVGSTAHLEDFAHELADVVIYADLTARSENIDLAAAIVKKFNMTSEKYNFKTRIEV